LDSSGGGSLRPSFQAPPPIGIGREPRGEGRAGRSWDAGVAANEGWRRREPSSDGVRMTEQRLPVIIV
jgi:hypothetical protein